MSEWRTWWEAEEFCVRLGGHLSSFANRSSWMAVIMGQITQRPLSGGIWIGAMCGISAIHLNLRDFHWTDGKPSGFYGEWDLNYPQQIRGLENCVEMNAPSFKWRNVACSINRPYWSCTIEKGVVPPPSLENGDAFIHNKRNKSFYLLMLCCVINLVDVVYLLLCFLLSFLR